MPRAPRDTQGEEVDAYLDSLEQLHQRLDEGFSFSGNERNRVFLNCLGQGASDFADFADVSAVSGLDFADDARGLAFFDLEGDGDLDLWLSNRTAPRARLMRNDSPAAGRSVRLRLVGNGTTTNRDAVGARVLLDLEDGRSMQRSVRAGDGFLSQSSLWLHFGLGESRVRGAAVHWPGGASEAFDGLRAGRSYELVQGSGKGVRGAAPRSLSLVASAQEPAATSTGRRVVLASRVPAPSLTLSDYPQSGAAADLDPTGRVVPRLPGTPQLINLWASWCVPCRNELREITDHAARLEGALDLVAFSIDGMGEDAATTPADAQRLMAELDFPFPHGMATPATLDKVDLLQRALFDRIEPLALPFSVLVDGDGYVAALYRGGVTTEQLLADLDELRQPAEELRALAVPFDGRWFTPPSPRASVGNFAKWFSDSYPDEAVGLLERAAEEARASLARSDAAPYELRVARNRLEEALRSLAVVEKKRGRFAEAARWYEEMERASLGDGSARPARWNALFRAGAIDELEAALRARIEMAPGDADAHARLAEVLRSSGREVEALSSLERAVDLDPANTDLRFLYAGLLAGARRADEAMAQLELVVEQDPAHEDALLALANGAIQQRDGLRAMGYFERVVEVNPANVEGLRGLARSLVASRRIGEGIERFEAILSLAPDDAGAHHEMGIALLNTGQLALGVASLRRALEHDEDAQFLQPTNEIAWLLATHDNPRVRNGRLALELAEEMERVTEGNEMAVLETKAAAQAELGELEGAMKTMERALMLPTLTGKERQLVMERLDQYRARAAPP